MLHKSLLSRLFGGQRTAPDAATETATEAAAETATATVAETATEASSPADAHTGRFAQLPAEPYPAGEGDPQAADDITEERTEDAGFGPSSASAAAAQGEAGGVIAGRVEQITEAAATGWAFDAGRPSRPVTVTAFLGATPVAWSVADIARPDLAAELGTTACGFRLDLSHATTPDLARHLTVVAAPDGWPTVLHAPEPVAQALIAQEPVAQAPVVQAPVVQAQAGRSEASPLFVIGGAPDASAVLAKCLMHATGRPGHEHGQLLPLVQALVRTVNQFYRQGLASAPPDALIRHVEGAFFFQSIRQMFIDAMAERFPGGLWIDNTPGLAGIQAATVLRMMWPQARFVFVASRVLESVAMRAEADPARSMRDHVAGWVREMQAWTDVRDRLRKCSMVLDRLTILSEPEAAAARLADFLSLDEDRQRQLAVDLTDAVHALGGDAVPLSASRLEAWSGPAGDALRADAEAMMAAHFYAWDDAYFLPPAEAAAA